MVKEDIKKIIIQNAKEEANAIINEARKYAEDLSEQAKRELTRIKIQEEAKYRYWEQLERSREIGKALQTEKDLILKAKHSVIRDIIKKFWEDYRGISAEEYREILKNLFIEAYSEVKGGDITVYVSEKDRSMLEEILYELGINVTLEIKKEKFDGVIIEDKSRGFLIYNTIENRLERAQDILLEEFSKILLGE